MAELGRAALVVCFGLVVYALVAGSLAAHAAAPPARASRRRTRSLAAFARPPSPPASCSSRSRAATSRSRTSPTTRAATLPLRYTLSAFWGGQEGSLLLWLLVLTGYGAAAVCSTGTPRAS